MFSPQKTFLRSFRVTSGGGAPSESGAGAALGIGAAPKFLSARLAGQRQLQLIFSQGARRRRGSNGSPMNNELTFLRVRRRPADALLLVCNTNGKQHAGAASINGGAAPNFFWLAARCRRYGDGRVAVGAATFSSVAAPLSFRARMTTDALPRRIRGLDAVGALQRFCKRLPCECIGIAGGFERLVA